MNQMPKRYGAGTKEVEKSCEWLFTSLVLSLYLFSFFPIPLLSLLHTSVSYAEESNLTPEVEAAIQRGLVFMKNQQKKDGGFAMQNPVGSAGIALLGFLANGYLPDKGEFGENVTKLVEYLLRSRNTYTGYMGQSMYEHGFATLALADVWGEYKDTANELEQALEQAVQLCVSVQNKEGGWRYRPGDTDSDISVASSIIQALRAAREAFFYVPEETMKNAAQYVKRCQVKDGGFGYQAGGGGGGSGLARTGAGVMCLMAAGFFDSEQVLRGLQFLVRRPQLEQSWASYGAYYTVLAMYQGRSHDKRFWNDWYPKIQAQILKAQRKDGSFVFQGGGQIGSIVDTGFALVALGIQKGYLPLFQR